MLDVCDLIYILKQNNGRIRNCIVTGYIGIEEEKPSTLYDSVDISINGRFVKMDCCTIEFKDEDYVRSLLHDGNNQRRYIVRGSLVTFVHSYTKLGDFYQIEGTLSFASKKDTDVVALFNFKKNGNWLLEPYNAKDVNVTNWDKSARPYNYLMESVKVGGLVIPQDIQGMRPFKAHKDKTASVLQSFGEPEKITEVSQEQLVARVDNKSSVSGREFFSRRELVPKNQELINKLKISLDNAKSNRKKQKEVLGDKFKETDVYIDRLVRNIKSEWTRGGRVLLRDYIDTVDGSDGLYAGQPIKEYLLTIKNELFDYLYDSSVTLTASGECLRIARALFGDKERFYAGVFSKIIGKDLSSAQIECENNNVSFSALVNTSPYTLIMFCPSLSFKDIEYIALCVNKASLPDNRTQRNICLLYDYLLRSNGNDTVYSIQELAKNKFSIRITNNELQLIQTRGTYLSKEKILNINKFLNIDVTNNRDGYLTENWVNYGNYNYSYLTSTEFQIACKSLVVSGLGVLVEKDNIKYMGAYSLVEKEFFIYNKIYDIYEEIDFKEEEERLGISIDEFISNELADFESQKGFVLEEQQKKCGELIKYKVSAIYGLAGGGKTTMAQCVVNMLLDLYGDDYVIKYAAPTGIASKRLEEVLEEKVYTMHSMFRVGGEIYVEEDNSSEFTVDADCYIFDEMSMVATDLLYKVLKRVKNPRIILLGDISQLAPISKGVPFRDLLHIIPCETLTVSKRSLEGSKISRNNDILINQPDVSLEEGDDFSILDTHNDSITNKIRGIVEYYLGKKSKESLLELGIKNSKILDKEFKPNEIQVLSPVAQPKYPWGTASLNRMLQSVFNPQPSNNCFLVGTQEGLQLRVGDRVLHKDNDYRILHYEYDGKYKFKRTCNYGVVNGDIGYIKGILPASQCIFEEADDNFTYETEVKNLVRDDEEFVSDKNALFLVVDFQGFYALYPMYESAEYSTSYQRVYKGKELKSLDLAYALTVHKTQGSQRQLIIFAIGQMNFSDFISLNLLYTGVSRASVAEFLIGDVSSSPNSTLSRGRKRLQQNNVSTVMSLMYN